MSASASSPRNVPRPSAPFNSTKLDSLPHRGQRLFATTDWSKALREVAQGRRKVREMRGAIGNRQLTIEAGGLVQCGHSAIVFTRRV